jgi:CHAD domain-containing protein
LVRDELGEDVFRDENWSFRDAGRLLSEVRDAEMVVETFELLEAERFPATVGPEALVTIHKALLANRKEVTRRILGDRGAFAAVEASATRALARLENWTIERDDWTAVEAGLGRVYRKGRRAIALARETPSVEHLHEWRKEVKYLRHQLQLLEASLTSSGQKMAKQVRELSRVLGDDRDLAVLRETLAADPLTYGGHRVLKGVFAIIDRRRKEIERHADALGRTVHEDPPIVFMKRMEAAYADLHADEPAAT